MWKTRGAAAPTASVAGGKRREEVEVKGDEISLVASEKPICAMWEARREQLHSPVWQFASKKADCAMWEARGATAPPASV